MCFKVAVNKKKVYGLKLRNMMESQYAIVCNDTRHTRLITDAGRSKESFTVLCNVHVPNHTGKKRSISLEDSIIKVL